MTDKKSLGDRIKLYEDAYRTYLPNRLPLILRLDGSHFHTFTRPLKNARKPFNEILNECLNETAIYCCHNIQGVKLAYLQSDEISFLIYNDKFNSESWFNNNLQKIVSVSASMFGAYFTSLTPKLFNGETKIATFDSRAFILPTDEVSNYFWWREDDAIRNSIQSIARSYYFQSELYNKDLGELKEMLLQKGIDWENDYPMHLKRGRCIIKENYTVGEAIRYRWIVDNNIPIFYQDRQYTEKYLKPELKELDWHLEEDELKF